MKGLKEQIESIMHLTYAKEVKEASVLELYNVIAKAIMLEAEPKWAATRELDCKRCGYLSAEFLIGRLIYANLLNMQMLEDVKDALKEYELDINLFEEVEDAALGNGGLGRLAACFLESVATKDIHLDGYGLRYRFGLFKQSFVNGFQNEEADDWLKWGDPFSIRRAEDTQIVHFKDFDVKAVPYDMPVIGYGSHTINTLRLWQSEPMQGFDFATFDKMEGEKIAIQEYNAKELTAVLYPNDNTLKGKILRLRQEYFMVSASLQDVLSKYKKTKRPLADLPQHHIWQLNDTHPTLAIPEMLRLLEVEGLDFEQSLQICKKMFNFTNHTIMGEALEKWPVEMLKEYLPEVLEQIEKLQAKLETELEKDKYYIIKDGLVHMAYLAIYVGDHVNGVAEIHTNILKNDTFKDWYQVYPEKFVNVTNGVTPRRWLALNNPYLAEEITKRIGKDWVTHLSRLSEMKLYVEDPTFLRKFKVTRMENKKILKEYIYKHEHVLIPTKFMFDIQIKRLHEYKRQLLNALSILYIYYGIKDGSIKDFKPTAFIFGAKSAPGYYMAKAIIKLINTIADKVNHDPEVTDLMKVVFVANYNVSYAEKLVCAADLSEQISMAGMEASGTGNMKFMINGTPTIGTLDGANVEICQEAGRENNYIFGATVEEVAEIKKNYNPSEIVEHNLGLKRVVESLIDGSLDDNGTGVFQAIYDSLLKGSNPDHYLVLADFASYLEAKLLANQEFDTLAYYKKCVMNMQASGKFSSDRSIQNYNEEIWKLQIVFSFFRFPMDNLPVGNPPLSWSGVKK